MPFKMLNDAGTLAVPIFFMEFDTDGSAIVIGQTAHNFQRLCPKVPDSTLCDDSVRHVYQKF